MTNCVTNLQKKSAEYIAAMDKFNISSGELEMILHEYLNLPENAKMFQEGKLSFPPDSYIQQALYGEESIVSDTNTVLMYEKVFSKPFITPDKILAMQAANEAAKYFENKSIKIRETKDGLYQVLVTPPVYLGGDIRVEAEIDTILENAPRDEQGRLLAPNGKPSNLTERQYAQVRTKAFKEWFGDWESLAEANLNIHDFIRNLNLNKTLLKNTTFPNSKIRNSVFHVSKLVVNKFSKDKTNTNAPDTELGYFFAEDLDTITTLRKEKHYAGVKDILGHNVHIVDINLKNPLIVDAYISELPIKLGYVTEEEFSKFDSSEKHSLYKRIREDVESKGYDGIQYVLGYELDEDGFPIRSGGYVVFDSNNIKVKSIKNDKSFTNFDAINNVKTLANNVSKVVDENGEPMVVYHGSPEVFNEFDLAFFGRTDPGDNGRGHYFAYDKEVALQYGINLMPVFLNIRNPYIHTGIATLSIVHGFNRPAPTKLESLEQEIKKWQNILTVTTDPAYRPENWDSTIEHMYQHKAKIALLRLNIAQQELLSTPPSELQQPLWDSLDTYDGVMESDPHYQLVVRNSNQIKSATDNIGTFSRESNNIYYNIVRNSNPKENLLITLRQEGLIHRHGTRDRYVLTLNADTKQGSQNDIDSVTRRQLIQQAANKVYLRLESLGFPKNTINITDTKSGGTAYVDVNENVLEQVKDAVSLGATIQDIKAVYDLADFLGEKFGVKFGGIISLKQANQMTNNANPNAFILNNTVYVVANRVTVDTIAEEFLHPFVNTLYLQSPKVFKQLYDEAVELFPNLKTQIYSNYRGRKNHKFTASDLQQELVAQALSRHFREEYEQSLLNGSLTVQETLKKMDESENFFTKAWDAIKRLFKELQDKLIGEKYVFEGNDLRNLSLRQVAKLINTSDSSFWTIHDTKTRFSLSEERLPISESNKDIITERPLLLDELSKPIILSSELSSFLKDIEFFKSTKFTSTAPDTPISIPYSDWKKALSISEALDGDEVDIINEFIHIYGSNEELFEYNKETKLYKIPYHYAVATRLLNKYPELSTLLVKEFNKLNDREFENIISAIAANLNDIDLIYSLLKGIGVKYQYIDKTQLEINFNNLTKLDNVNWARTSENNYEVSSQGDKRFSALYATFKEGTTIFGHDVSGRTIESVYQHGIKQGDWVTNNNSKTGAPRSKDIIKGNTEDASYAEGYLPLWQEWAKQNPELIEELRNATIGKTLTDKFASTRVSQARALADILNSYQLLEKQTQETSEKEFASTETAYTESQNGITNVTSSELPLPVTEKPKASDNLTTKDREKTENEVFFEKQSILREQLKAVYGIDSDFTGEEFRQIAADIVYEISDIITEVEKNPEAILKYNSVAKVENVSGSSRASILSQIGIGNILDYIKKNNFSPFNGTTGNPNIAGRKDAKKAKIISNNINAFLTQGASLLLQLEGFGITDNLTVNEDVDTETIEDLNNDNERETIQETVGSLQEHWLIENRTENAFDKASVLVKQALTQCYKLNPNGTPVVSKWGIKQRMDGRESMLSIIRWTQGALTLSAMIKKLEALSKKNPWVIPIIERLKDTSGKESTFQSQFFGTVSKYFQLYSVGKKENGLYSVFEVNTHPALSDAKKSIGGLYNAGAHPLFDSNGLINTTSFEQLKSIWELLEKKTFTPENSEEIAELLSNVSRLLGYPISKEALLEVLDDKTFQLMTKKSLLFIIKDIEDNKNNTSWQPFSGKKEDNGIINNIGKFITPITDKLEDVTNTSFYDSGNTYQSYVTPSYLTKLIQKFRNLSAEEYEQFLLEEYGKYELFKLGEDWKNSWLELFENNPSAREIFAHKVQLNFAGNRYMLNRGGSKAMSEAELTLSILAEYFREEGFKTTKELAPTWFRVPLMSNKPSSEFIRFFSYRGPNYKDRVLKGCIQLFTQELSRIQTVKKRNELYTEDDPEWIENFDVKGSKFCFFDFLNDVENKRFHELVELVTTYTQKEGDTDNSKLDLYTTELTTLAKKLIKEHIESEFKKQYEQWQNNGVVEATSQIKSIPENGVTAALENFFWNDFLAANNILNLTITDLAYYKNTEDVQKRLAQLHAPGIRPNLEARDFKGNKVADSKTRTLYLKDVEIDGEKIKSNIIANVKAVFLKKLDALEKNSPQYLASEALYKNIIKLFEEGINIADAQGYACPTSYRKKALLFGKWDTHSEEIYQKLIKGDYTFTDLKVAFQPLKPFVYTQVEHDTNIENGGLPTIKMGVQNKNSEYLLIMANAITQNEDTGLPNYLRAIYKIMEDSHKGTIDKDGNHIPRVDGIDTIQFESTVKTGKTGLIDITEALSTEEAEALLEGLIYEDKLNHKYDNTYLQELNFEDYCILQEVPEHFKDHEQLQGSQIRMIIPSDLNTDENVKYNVEGRDLTAQEFRDEYERTIAENIEDSIKELMGEFGIDENNPKTKKEQNIALAKTLQKEILSSPRYGLDLLMACLLNEQGDFTIPLGDSIQSKRIEQLLNSIIKNRVNKQKIAGGPVVQVTNFGTSRQLNIRFKSKDGSTLFTLTEYIELGKTELEWVDYINENLAGIAYYECFAPAYMLSIFELFMDAKGNIDIEAIEKTDPDLLKMIGYRIPSEDKYSLAPIKIVGFMPKEAGDGIMLPYEITLITGSDFDIDKFYLMRKEIPVVTKPKKEIRQALISKLGKEKKDDIDIFLNQISNPEQSLAGKSNYPEVWSEYTKIAYKANPYTEGRKYRNNKIIDMSWEVLTHEDTADKVLNPGGFEEQKREGYLAEAARIKGTYRENLEHLRTKELKKICESNKNLAFIGTHAQFYKQNAAAGSILAIFAVAKVAHACLEGNGFTVDVSEICGIENSVSIMGLNLLGRVEIDPQKDIEGNFIGKTLGSLVASAADAVKDPVLNLMNINSDTVNILNTLIRLGLPFRKAARLLSTNIVSEVLQQYNLEKLKNPKTSFNTILTNVIDSMISNHNLEGSDTIFEESLTEDEVEYALFNSRTNIDFKILLTLKRISDINYTMSGLNFATRFNSISSAVGPLIIDNLKAEHTMDNFPKGIYTKNGEAVGIQEVLDKHPILKAFSKTVNLARKLFGKHMPLYSNHFGEILDYLDNTNLLNNLFRDRKLLSRFSDFYQSVILAENGVVSTNPKVIHYYVREFAADFAKNDYKSKYKGNPFIEAIRFDVDANSKVPTLKINVTGLDTEAKSKLTSGWLDLYKSGEEGKKLALDLFKYCFYKGGIGFNPQTFMHLFPVLLRAALEGYKESFEQSPIIEGKDLVNLFIRNNWEDDTLVPYKKFGKPLNIHQGGYVNFIDELASSYKRILAFKTIINGLTTLFIRTSSKLELSKDNVTYYAVQPLGNNGEFLEFSFLSSSFSSPSVVDSPKTPIISNKNNGVENIYNEETRVNKEISEKDARNMALVTIDKYFSTKELLELKELGGQFSSLDTLSANDVLKNMKNEINNRLKAKGVEVNNEKLEQIAKEFC